MEQSYLDALADKVFGFVYFKLLHGYINSQEEEAIKKQIELLSAEEKDYIVSCVQEAFREIKKDNDIRKTA